MGFLRDRVPKLLALLGLIVITPLPVLVNHFQIATLDPDIWWHVRVGQWILQNHAVPHNGIFSQHAMDHGWIAYSWGFEVLSAMLMRAFGLAFIPLMLGFMRALIAFAIFVMAYRISRRFWAAWLIATVAVMGFHLVMVARPVLFTILFFAIEMGLIFEARTRRSIRPLCWLPLVFWVWANTHIQFIYGVAVLVLLAVCESIAPLANKWLGDSKKAIAGTRVQWALLILGSFVATSVGPYGAAVYGVIFRYAGNTAQYTQIQELAAMGFRNIGDYAVLLLLMAACYVLGKVSFDLFNGSLLLVAAVLAFRSGRDVWFLCIAAGCIIAEQLQQKDVATASTESKRSEVLQFVATFVFGFALVFGFMRSEGLDPQSIVSSIDATYPIQATQYVSDHHLPGPMYNSFDWGGFLIFNLREYPVSIDGRNDFYGPQNFARVQNTMNGFAWKSDLDLAQAGFVLMERVQPLAKILQKEPDFKLVYSDHVAVVFVRTTGEKQ
jgi:hypothetical protein